MNPTRRVAAGWREPLLGSTRCRRVRPGHRVVRDFQLKEMQPTAEEVVDRTATTWPQPIRAMTALMAIDPSGNESLVGRARGCLRADRRFARERPVAGMSNGPRAHRALSRLPTAPDDSRRRSPRTGPPSRGAEPLLDAIAAGKASARLLQEQRVAVCSRAANPPGVADRIPARLASPPADQKLALMDRRRAGFPRDVHRPE